MDSISPYQFVDSVHIVHETAEFRIFGILHGYLQNFMGSWVGVACNSLLHK